MAAFMCMPAAGRTSCWLAFLLCSLLSGHAQQKKILAEEDYSLWHTLAQPQLAPDGRWASYRLRYEAGDTLVVRNIKGNQTFALPNAKSENFIGKGYFACLEGTALVVRDLKTGKVAITPNVVSYQASPAGDYLVARMQRESISSLAVLDTTGAIIHTVEGATEWVLNRTGNAVAFTQYRAGRHRIGILRLAGNVAEWELASSEVAGFHNMAWQKDGNGLAFLQYPVQTGKGGKAHYYDLVKGKEHTLTALTTEGFPVGYGVADTNETRLLVSDDGSRIFLGIKDSNQKLTQMEAEAVEVWNAEDKLIYPARQQTILPSGREELAVWLPSEGRLIKITDDALPQAGITANHSHAVRSDPWKYEPQMKQYAPRDYEIMDMESSTSRPLLSLHSGADNALAFSPGGKFILYFKGSDWYVYEVEKEVHRNITAALPATFYELDKGQQRRPYGSPGFESADRSVLLYDAYDIWSVSLTDGRARRWTNGRETGRTFRVAPGSPTGESHRQYGAAIAAAFDLEKPLLLEATGKDFASGYYLLDGSCLTEMAFGAARLGNGKMSADGTSFLYTRQDYDDPPSLFAVDLVDNTSTRLLQTNRQHYGYLWGKSELIQYQNSRKQTLSGVLYYPAGFEKGKKYPMVVNIYELKSHLLHHYVNPKLSNEEGFNVTNLTSRGYLVLLPDIVYETGHVGASATDCVLAAVNKVIGMGIVEDKKMALTGHSFGGYQTDYILTQTDLFAAAVAGAAITDLTSRYFSLTNSRTQLEFWRFEFDGQLRMGKSIFADQEMYLRNSPVLMADQIKTPLLAWSGKADTNVWPSQSIEMFLALRRMQKKHVFLLYPGEQHSLSKKANMIDLTRKIESWLGYHLKEEPMPEWMQPQ